MKKLILSAGGTGGHLFPAQSLAKALPEYNIQFVAGGLATNRYFRREEFPFQEIDAATFSFSSPLQVIAGCRKIVFGMLQARRILADFKPDAVIGFGMQKIPIILHEQNAIPGKVNRLFAPFARQIAITFPVTRELFKKKAREKTVEVLFPLRKNEIPSQREAWDYFGLVDQKIPTLLIFGGSQGAQRLNTLFLEAIPSLPKVQVLHFTGGEEQAAIARDRYARLGLNAYVRAFESRMDLAMRIADCAITRAGAATVCELIEFGLPAFLIPYPFATENHQEKNGEHFVESVKGGKMYKEKELTASLLATVVMELLGAAQLMRKNIASYKMQNKVRSFSQLIKDIV
jgi:UDP-N-acetylglucosamine--N-acetylmuramyl-(pentapeptide) pyrophosphoryl-undecaprenol N-acetylglucosamine transferase